MVKLSFISDITYLRISVFYYLLRSPLMRSPVHISRCLETTCTCHALFFILSDPRRWRLWIILYSLRSAEMKALNPQEKGKLGLKFETESEFWIPFDDFLKLFTHVDVCHFVNTSGKCRESTLRMPGWYTVQSQCLNMPGWYTVQSFLSSRIKNPMLHHVYHYVWHIGFSARLLVPSDIWHPIARYNVLRCCPPSVLVGTCDHV